MEADVLEVMDCCNAGALRKDHIESVRRHEIIATYGLSGQTSLSGKLAFVNLFLQSLRRHRTGIDTPQRHLEINNRILQSLSQNAVAEPGHHRWDNRAIPESPVRFDLSNGRMGPIRLSPLHNMQGF